MSHSLVLHSFDKVIIDYWLRHKYITWHNSCDARTQKRNIKLVRYRFHSQPYSRPVEIKRISYRRAANLPKGFYFLKEFNAPPTHIVCIAHLIANFPSFHMNLVVVMNYGAGNVLRGFEISMFYFFLKLYFIHISKDILPLRAQNAIKQYK